MRSLDQCTEVRRAFTDLPEVSEELLSVTYELVDGLNRLSEGRHQKLFETHHNLAGAIREALEKDGGGTIPCPGPAFSWTISRASSGGTWAERLPPSPGSGKPVFPSRTVLP